MSIQEKSLTPNPHHNKLRNLRVIIIGAGMSGVLMGIRLKQAGIHNFSILEKGDKVGGTWRENDYPGLHCDVHAFAYCYSFDPNPEWSQMYAAGTEIRDYFERMAVKYGVLSHIRFNTTATAARWHEGQWHITCDNGASETADVLVSASGILHIPKLPDIPGLETFSGPCFHSTRWDNSVPLAGRKIGVIGGGSTATQIVTALADQSKSLTLFSRTPHWVGTLMPNSYKPFSPGFTALLRRSPRLTRFFYDLTMFLWGVFTSGGIMGKSRVIRWMVTRNVKKNLATVKDPVLRKKLTPDYVIGCKRLVLSPNFYQVMQQPNVHYVSAAIERVTPEGVVTADGQTHPLDVLALATGFDSNAFLGPLKLSGENGHTLEQLWADNPSAYHTLAIPHMPNFFMLQGPYSPAGNLPFTAVSEWQSEYIMKCIERIRRDKDRLAMAPTEEATGSVMAKYRAQARTTIWSRDSGGCSSWYQGKDGVPIIYPFTSFQFRREMAAEPNFDEFDIRTYPAA